MTEQKPAMTPEAEEAVARLQELTDEANEKRMEASRIAHERREVILALRNMDWSFRRIGETIGVSGQRIDSMIRLGEKLAARDEEAVA